MRPKDYSNKGQLWNVTGESRLQNFAEKDLFLTANSDKSLGFKKRDPDENGQIWELDWHPTSKLFANHAINIYGGRNVNGATVGLYPKSCSPNEEWRREHDNNWLSKPECINIKYYPERATVAYYDKEAKDHGFVNKTTYRNAGEADNTYNYEQEAFTTKETSSSNTQNVQFEAGYKYSLGASVGVEGIATVEAGHEFSFTATIGESFTQGKATVTSEKINHKATIPVKGKTKVEVTVIGKKVTITIPCTMSFNDGSTMEDTITYKESSDMEIYVSPAVAI